MIQKTVIAGGCFWGLEHLIRDLKGVISTTAGYAGGENENPTYENHPGHAEAVQVEYDDEVIDYQHILDFFFQIHNPTTLNQQGNDKGTSYRSAIFIQNEREKEIAQSMIDIVNQSQRWDNPVVTTIEPLTRFWPAEDYHQDYLVKNPGGYTCHAIYFSSYLQ